MNDITNDLGKAKKILQSNQYTFVLLQQGKVIKTSNQRGMG